MYVASSCIVTILYTPSILGDKCHNYELSLEVFLHCSDLFGGFQNLYHKIFSSKILGHA